ncbi:MAG: lytic transglycosylase domain-containing protein [Chloracidobacterium sp.]|nr:lytic transglycosylase domain-containing protein [Chloracidobacterium sp.]
MIDRAITALLMVLIFAAPAAAQDGATLSRAAVYEPLMIEAGKRHGIDPRVIWTVAFLETKFQPRLVSEDGACGMMQFLPATARRYGLDDPFDPVASIDAAARYLSDLQAIFNGRLDLILAAYNAGERAVLAFRDGRQLALSDGKIINPQGIRTGGVPPYRETRSYVKNGIALYLKLAKNKEDNAALEALKRGLEGESENGEDLPPEIIELKQESIYVIEASPQPGQPARAPRSIYPRL